MKKLKMISYYILLILLCLNLLILSLILPLKYTLFNESYMKQELEKQNYDTKVYEEIKTQMNHYLIQSGLDESVFDNIVTKEKVKEDIDNNLTFLYENKECHIDTTSITNQLEENIENYLALQNIEVLCGPKMSQAEKIIVQALLNQYCPNGKYQESKLRIR